MDTKLDINHLHTHLLRQTQGDFKLPEDSLGTELHLSMLHFMLPNGEAVEVEVISKSLILMGRQSGNEHEIDIDLSDFGAESGISRTHAAIQLSHTAVFVRDFESRNGTYLNGEILQPMKDYVLHDGDVLRLGKVKLRVIFVP